MAVHYPHLLDPKQYPEFTRRAFIVPTWDTFGNKTQFTSLRVFTVREGKLVDFREDLDAYTKTLELGNVIWPHFSAVFAENFKELALEIKRRGLFLFDIWGHVPSNSTQAEWGHVKPPPGLVDWLQQNLGEQFLGFDVGEQDGRYVAGYALQQCPMPQDRIAQYYNFQRHFQRMGDDLGNKLTALVSLTYGHHLIKENNFVLIGAETAQALPSSHIYYAFIRGAAKQYGIHWFGNASIFNRWGWKTYESEGVTGDPSNPTYLSGPTHGSSLALLKRLIYTHYLYNAVAIGFEQSWIMEDNTEKRLIKEPTRIETDRSQITLSPVGAIQAAAVKFVRREGHPGVMHAPVAVLLDFFAGWTVPRHLYTQNLFQVWGAMPYGPGDYLAHGVFAAIYPGYEDASFYHDERGFLSPTPYGDMADAVLSDIPLWVLRQYGLVIVTSEVPADIELRDKLEAFVREGGHLVITAQNARLLWPEWQISAPRSLPAGSRIRWKDGSEQTEPRAFELYSAMLPKGARVLASCGEDVAVAEVGIGSGKVTLLLSPFGINTQPVYEGLPDTGIDKPLPMPFVPLEHIEKAVGHALSDQQIFSVGHDDLGFITCRKGTGRYTLGVFNNQLDQRPLRITTLRGTLQNVRELQLEQGEKKQVGYWPHGMQDNDPGVSSESSIAGGDIRLFDVQIKESDLRVLSRVTAPAAVRDRMIAFRGLSDLKEFILARPTFFQHFDGVKIDYTYLLKRDAKQVERERGWISRQKLRVVVDFTPGANLYPDLALLDTLKFRYDESIEQVDDVLEKMRILGATQGLFSLHRPPENNFTYEQAAERFKAGLEDVCGRAASRGIELAMQHGMLEHPLKWRGSVAETLQLIAETGLSNLRFALNLSHRAHNGPSLSEAIAAAGHRLAMVLLSSMQKDILGQAYDPHAPLRESQPDLGLLRGLNAIQILDVDYQDWNDAYLDVRAAWGAG